MSEHADAVSPDKKREGIFAQQWTLSFCGTYKSIGDLVWPGVPSFAVVTGENGSGKSHLLEAIRDGISSHGGVQTDARGNITLASGPFSLLYDKRRYESKRVSLERAVENGKATAEDAREELDRLKREIDTKYWKGQVLNIPDVLRYVDDETFGPPVINELKSGDVVLITDAFQRLSIEEDQVSRVGKTMLAQMVSNDKNFRRRTSVGSGATAMMQEVGITEPTYVDLTRYASSNPGMLIRMDAPLYGVAEAFQVYRTAMMVFFEERLLGAENDEDVSVRLTDAEAALGIPPWKLLNETLRAAGFDFRITSPIGSDGEERFVPAFVKEGIEIDARSLSSGEKTMVGVICSLYTSETGGTLPRLLLLDEPDAHLHPSLTRQLLSVLKGVLVDRHGIRVIITTHSPSTVALAPDDSVFLLSRNPQAICRTDKWEAASVLTAGITAVGPERKAVFVEDQDDEMFYRVTAEIAEGSWMPEVLRTPPGRLNFLPSSWGRGDKPTGAGDGGWTVVKRFIEDIGGTHIRGLIDRDSGNDDKGDNPRVHLLGRYSMENYLIDPLVLYVYSSRRMYKEGKGLQFEGFELSKGMEAEITAKPAKELQRLVDAVSQALFEVIEDKAPDLVADTESVTVEWTSGQRLTYPAWLLRSPGKKIKGYLQDAFGFQYHFDSLLDNYGILRALPVELAQTLRKIARA